MAELSTLVEDIYKVVEDRGGWDKAVNDFFKEQVGATTWRRLAEPEEERGTLRMSSIGQPCERKLWYSVNAYKEGEPLRPETRIKFLYGDILEDLLLSLAVAAGHTVQGHQDELTIAGIKGHRDAVIDGVTVDVKSASTFSFKKFQQHNLEKEDPFGYLTQLASYVYAAKGDPLVTDNKGGAFLVIDKQHGKLCLDYYDFEATGHLKAIPELYADRIESAGKKKPPFRGYRDVDEGKSGNKKLCMECSYCGFKKLCWPGLRTFTYARGPVFLTKVKRKPDVPEVRT